VPRPPDAARDAQLWELLVKSGRMLFRRSTPGIVVRRPSGEQQVIKTGPGLVTIVGEPGELVMIAFGRTAARVEYEGDAAAVKEVTTARRGV
jgi:hypothetical protein